MIFYFGGSFCPYVIVFFVCNCCNVTIFTLIWALTKSLLSPSSFFQWEMGTSWEAGYNALTMLTEVQAILKLLSLGAFTNDFVSSFSFCASRRVVLEDKKVVLTCALERLAAIFWYILLCFSRVSSDVSSFISNFSNSSLLYAFLDQSS